MYKIESGVPLVAKTRTKFPFDSMQVPRVVAGGDIEYDSFLIPAGDNAKGLEASRQHVHQAARLYSKRVGREFKVATRTVEGGLRVFRVA